MKVLFVACVLACFGCGPSTDVNTVENTGTVQPNRDPGIGSPNEVYFNACAAGWQYVTVWVNGQPQPQLQLVICNQGFNPDTGDPMIDKGDPDPNHVIRPNINYILPEKTENSQHN